MRETESLLIEAQKKAIGNNYIKGIIDKTQQKSKCRLCGNRDEAINHLISECIKLAQEYKTRHDGVGKEIHLEWRKKFRFDHTSKWYMHWRCPWCNGYVAGNGHGDMSSNPGRD